MSRIRVNFDNRRVWYPLTSRTSDHTIEEMMLSVSGRKDGTAFVEDAELVPSHLVGDLLEVGDVVKIVWNEEKQKSVDSIEGKIKAESDSADGTESDSEDESESSSEDESESESESESENESESESDKSETPQLAPPHPNRSRLVLTVAECSAPDVYDVKVPSFPFTRPECRKFTKAERKTYMTAAGATSNHMLPLVQCPYVPRPRTKLSLPLERGTVAEFTSTTLDYRTSAPKCVNGPFLVRGKDSIHLDQVFVSQDPSSAEPDYGLRNVSDLPSTSFHVIGFVSIMPPEHALLDLRCEDGH